MEVRLSDQIDGCCASPERRVDEVEQKSEECLISLEMARTEIEQGWVEFEKQFGDLHLEVNRLNRFLELENMENP
jgi:hypothetical protein